MLERLRWERESTRAARLRRRNVRKATRDQIRTRVPPRNDDRSVDALSHDEEAPADGSTRKPRRTKRHIKQRDYAQMNARGLREEKTGRGGVDDFDDLTQDNKQVKSTQVVKQAESHEEPLQNFTDNPYAPLLDIEDDDDHGVVESKQDAEFKDERAESHTSDQEVEELEEEILTGMESQMAEGEGDVRQAEQRHKNSEHESKLEVTETADETPAIIKIDFTNIVDRIQALSDKTSCASLSLPTSIYNKMRKRGQRKVIDSPTPS